MRYGWVLLLLLMAAACTGGPADPTAGPVEPTQPVAGFPTPTQETFPGALGEAPTAASESANADVEAVRAVLAANGTWTFYVTVRHPDTGWDDYADGWDVVLPDGTVLKPDPDAPFTRLLTHPHEAEQPFTRSQSGIVIPEAVTEVHVRAHDRLAGYGGHEVVVDLMVQSGENFTVERP